MDERFVFADTKCGNEVLMLKFEEDEEEFKSCFEDEDELKDREERHKGIISVDDDHVKMYFKGVSFSGPGDSGSRISGIGVVIERTSSDPVLQVQKKLDFYVEELVAEYLALLDGLTLSIQNDVRKICVFTDSEVMHTQLMNDEEAVDIPLLEALRQRILEQVNGMEAFVLKLVSTTTLEKALHLARVAVGFVSTSDEGDKSEEICSICGKERLTGMMLTIKCSHKFCSHCMRSYVDRKLKSAKLLIRCPQSGCKHYISASEFKSFLTVVSYELLERTLAESNVICCPYSSCSALLDPDECRATKATSSSQNDSFCLECHACQHLICLDCKLPWHSSLTCEEYRCLPEEEKTAFHSTAHHLVRNKRWRSCEHCRRIVELTNGCYHMRCWCGHEFCYTCGAEYRDGQQTCHCALWDVDYSIDFSSYPPPNLEQWAWDSFESLPTIMDVYSDQERSQLELIQRFLAGGYSLSEHDSHQTPPRCTDSYAETMKDLHQLPWLERFVSVITDNYYEGYVQ